MTIDRFSGEFRWLSNFWPCRVSLDGAEYVSVEHAYQAAKTVDPQERLEFQKSDTTAAMAKKLGRYVTQRSDWLEVKIDIMFELTRQKYHNHPELGQKLLLTAPRTLIEGNTWGDKFWGVCEGDGQNHLGKILMSVRESLQNKHT